MDNLALDGDLKTQTPSENSICAFSTTPNLQLPLSNNSGESATQISTINTLTTSWLQALRSPSLPSRQITSTEEALQLRASMATLNTYLQNNATIETQSMVDDLKLAFCPFLEVGFNTYVFYRAFTKADCASDYLLAITAFLRNYYSLSDLQGIVDMILGLDVHIQGKISDNCTYEREEDVKYDDSNIEPQSFGDFSPRKLLDNWKSLSDSELLAKANRVVYGLVSAGLVKQFNLEFTSGSYKIFAERDLHTFKFSSINDLLYKVADLMVTFGETGYDAL